jgi:hypothetical protein
MDPRDRHRILRTIIALTLDSGVSEGHRRLALVYLQILHRQIVGRPP